MMDNHGVSGWLAAVRKFGVEATGIEVKASQVALSKSAKETVSAFANTPGGGTLLLGVSEDAGFVVVGVRDARKLQADVAAMCADELVPPVRPTITIGEAEGGAVVVVEIAELPKREKPCYVRSLGMDRGTFVRVGESDRRLTSEEIHQLVADRGQPVFDREPVPGAALSDLDTTAVRKYVARMRMASPRAFGDEPVDVVLRMTGVMARAADQETATLAGLLALGTYPQQFFPQLNVTFVHYPTSTGEAPPAGVRFLDNVSINGSIPVMVVETLNVLLRNMSRRALVIGAGRQDDWEYPIEALREAVVNALVHRDLSDGSRGTQVQIEMYPDRILVQNPGGLYGPIDATHLGEEGRSSARNAYLMKILEDVEVPGADRVVCENRGSGIRNMIAALRQAGMSIPKFTDRVTSFRVVMPNHTLLDDQALAWLALLGRERLRDSQWVALALMRRGEVMDNAKYRAATAITDSRVATFELQDLVARELVDQTGTRGAARYTLSHYAATTTDSRRRPRPNRRVQILDLLALRGDLSKGEISDGLRLNPKTAEHWLRKLKAEGLVESTEPSRSKNTRYRRSANGLEATLPLDE